MTVSKAASESSILDRATRNKLAQASPLLRRWYAPETLEMLYRNDLKPNVERVFSDEMAQQFHHYCPISDATDEDFKNGWLELPELGHSLIGIRFRGLDLNRPFVELVVSDELLPETMNTAAIKEAVGAVYELFQPKHLRFFLPSNWQGDVESWQGAYWEKRYLAAPVSEMRSLSKPKNVERLRLHKPSDMAFYEPYTDLYERRFEAQPSLREYSRIEEEEDMAHYLEEGTLFELYVDDIWAGVIVVTRAEEQGMKGFLVVDILLEPHFSGQGLGVAAQYRLANTLETKDGDVLFGTIDSRNVSAIKTAERSGGADVGGFLWLPL